MVDFRSETFFEFIQTQKPIWFIKIIWILSLLVLLIILFFFRSAFWSFFLFCIVILPLQTFFYYHIAYKAYSDGRKAFVELNDRGAEIIYDVNIFICGFNLFDKKSFLDSNHPIYDFDQADIIIGRSSIILLGKKKQFGTISYTPPVEIKLLKRLTSIPSASLLNWTEYEDEVIIEIKDELYNKPFKIEFKDSSHKLRLWLKSLDVQLNEN